MENTDSNFVNVNVLKFQQLTTSALIDAYHDGGLQTGSSYNSASRQNSNAVPTANPPFSGSSNPMALLRIVPDVTGSRFFKMAASIPEVVISRLPYNMATPSQRITPIFRVRQPNATITNSARCNRKSVFQDGVLQTGSTYISAFRPDSDAVSSATPPFPGCSNTIAAIFKSRLLVTSGSIRSRAIELLDFENGGLAVGTESLSGLEAEI